MGSGHSTPKKSKHAIKVESYSSKSKNRSAKQKPKGKTKPTKTKAYASKRKPIPRELRSAVWTKYHQNKDQGKCYCCGEIIFNRGWHCAHVISDVKGGETTIDNLRTTCRSCNLSMGDQNLYAYICKKRLRGPGRRNAEKYFAKYPDQRSDVRTNNWGRKTVV